VTPARPAPPHAGRWKAASRAARSRRVAGALAWAAAFAAGCAHGGGPPPEDATRDPEFEAALRDARPEFPTQRQALEAGLYETFLPPESLPPPVGDPAAARAPASPAGPAPADVLDGARPPRADPTTEELLATLPADGRRAGAPPPDAGRGGAPPARAPAPPGRVEAAYPEGAGERPSRPATAAASAGGSWTLQLGAFSSASAAWARADRARALVPGAPVDVVETGGLHRVHLGAFPSREEAEAEARRLDPLGLGDAWVTRRPAR
jgi:cell division protein FtsN